MKMIESYVWFCNIRRIPNGEINDRGISNLYPWREAVQLK